MMTNENFTINPSDSSYKHKIKPDNTAKTVVKSRK